MSGMELLFSDNRGVYIPRDFAEIVGDDSGWTNFDQKDIDLLLKGPEEESYWDVWNDIIDNIKFTDSNGNEWKLCQYGDLWLYCGPLMTDDEYQEFFGEPREPIDELDNNEQANWYDTSAELK